MTVEETLRASMAAHRAALLARQRGDPAARDFLTEAQTLRLAAVARDPQRTDAAWATEQDATAPGVDTHLALVAFYTRELAKPARRVRR